MRVPFFGSALALVMLCVVACAPSRTADDATSTTHTPAGIGDEHAGAYNLGPVSFAGSSWNSCAPYTPELEKLSGDLLAGLAMPFNGDGSLCDACILVTTAKGKSVTARVVTTGDTQGPNDIDLSQAAFDVIHEDEYPRSMTWELVKCPANGDRIQYQFQTEANAYWTSLWVRNARLPIRSVEVKSTNHPDFASLQRGTDGTLTDDTGFGEGSFTLRVTAYDGQVITDTFDAFVPGDVLGSASQFE